MLNLKEFEKVAEDGKTTTMRHKNGHEIRVILKALRPIEREQLKRLKMAEGGKVQRFADTEDTVKPEESNSSETPNSSTAQDQPGGTHITINAAQPAQPAAPAPQVQQSPAAKLAESPVNPAVGATPPNANMLNPNGTLNAPEAVNFQQKAEREKQAVEAAAGKQIANTEAARVKAEAELNKQVQNNYNEFKPRADALRQYNIDHPFNEKSYTENMAPARKVTTAIGLILGGMGQGLVGGSNPAMDYLNAQIDRDIAGQKERADREKTIYGAYKDLYGEGVATNALTKVSMNDIYTHKMNQAAAMLRTAQAKPAADAFAAQKALESDKLLKDASLNAALETANGMQGQRPLSQNTQQPQGGAMANQRPGGASGDWGGEMAGNSPTSGGKENDPNHILNPQAQKKYDQLFVSPNRTAQQVSDTNTQFQRATQADKSIDQIKHLFPEMKSKLTFSDWLASHIDPHAFGLAGGAAGAGAAALGVGATGGVGGLAGLPLVGALAAGGAGTGEAIAHGLKAVLEAASGQKGAQFHTALNSFITQVGNALGEGITPTQRAEIAKEFAPTWWNSDETADDKFDKLIKKIKAVTPTGALKGMTNN